VSPRRGPLNPDDALHDSVSDGIAFADRIGDVAELSERMGVLVVTAVFISPRRPGFAGRGLSIETIAKGWNDVIAGTAESAVQS
jgi:hypothetical protein